MHSRWADGGPVVGFKPTSNRDFVRPPRLSGPIYACEGEAMVTELVKGATVSVSINGKPEPGFVASGDRARVKLGGATLSTGDVIEVTQAVGGRSTTSNAVVVDQLPATLPAPATGPRRLYECGMSTSVSGYVGSAQVSYALRATSAASGDEFSLPLAKDDAMSDATSWPMTSTYPFLGPSVDVLGPEVHSEYAVCGMTAIEDRGAEVHPEPSDIKTSFADIAGPLYEGMDYVPVTGAYNGAQVSVEYWDGSGWSDYGSTYTPNGAANVWRSKPSKMPEVSSTSKFRVSQSLCTSSDRNVFTGDIEPCANLPAPEIEAPVPGSRELAVLERVPGSTVEVFDASGNKLGEGVRASILLSRPIATGETLFARQSVGSCAGGRYWLTDFNYPPGTSFTFDEGGAPAPGLVPGMRAPGSEEAILPMVGEGDGHYFEGPTPSDAYGKIAFGVVIEKCGSSPSGTEHLTGPGISGENVPTGSEMPFPGGVILGPGQSWTLPGCFNAAGLPATESRTMFLLVYDP